MTDLGLDLEERHHRHRRKRRQRRGIGCIVGLVVFVLIAIAIAIGITKGTTVLSGWLDGPADYSGHGSGSVVVEVKKGDTTAEIGRTLKSKGVVDSVDAFLAASRADARARSIQPGLYHLHKKMSARWALQGLTDTGNLVKNTITVREGTRLDKIVADIVKNSDITKSDLIAALKKPKSLGLPASADNNPEGYLYPATYANPPGTSATDLLSQMVAKTKAVDVDLDVRRQAKSLGLTAGQVIVVASILGHEVKRDQDYPKVARVIYNRLDAGMALQMDSTVAYVTKGHGDVWTTKKERASQSQYNTYKHTGLPPGPIGSPGKKTIEAALHPAKGNWLYFVAINLETGETEFADTYSEHLKNVEKSKAYCRKSDLC